MTNDYLYDLSSTDYQLGELLNNKISLLLKIIQSVIISENNSMELNEFIKCLINHLLKERISSDKLVNSSISNEEKTSNFVHAINGELIQKIMCEKFFNSNESDSNEFDYDKKSSILKQRRNKRGQYRRYETSQLKKAVGAVLNGSMSGNYY